MNGKIIGLLALATYAMSSVTASALDKVVFATDWKAQAGHGGFYQAAVDGTYAKYGLEVEITQGGPQKNNRPLLAAERIDFLMSSNLLLTFNNHLAGVKTQVVASMFQKDPQVFMAHKGEYKDFNDLTNAKTILVGKNGQFSFWQWLVTEKGFKNSQLRPYTYSLAPFFSDQKMVQQGYGTAEPTLARIEGVETDVYLFADQGWTTYASTIETLTKTVEENPDLVRRFVEASIEGWYNFIYGDRTAAYAAILKHNPDLSVEKLDAETEEFAKLNIIDVGDALTYGIGTMNFKRAQNFLDLAENSGLVEKGKIDIRDVVNLDYVNSGHGMDIKERLQAK